MSWLENERERGNYSALTKSDISCLKVELRSPDTRSVRLYFWCGLLLVHAAFQVLFGLRTALGVVKAVVSQALHKHLLEGFTLTWNNKKVFSMKLQSCRQTMFENVQCYDSYAYWRILTNSTICNVLLHMSTWVPGKILCQCGFTLLKSEVTTKIKKK